jgi:hypothetical protein
MGEGEFIEEEKLLEYWYPKVLLFELEKNLKTKGCG